MLLPLGSVLLRVVLGRDSDRAARSLLYCIMRIRESAAYTGYFCYLPGWVKLLVVPGMRLLLEVLQPAPARAQDTKGSLLAHLHLVWACVMPHGCWGALLQTRLPVSSTEGNGFCSFFLTVFWKCSWWSIQFWRAGLGKRLLSFLKIVN